MTTFADCTRATGAPGELVQRTSRRRRHQRLGPAGLTRVAALESDRSTARGPRPRPGGAGVVAFPVLREAVGKEAERLIQAAVRDPGGAWGPVRDAVPAPELANGNSLAVAVSEPVKG